MSNDETIYLSSTPVSLNWLNSSHPKGLEAKVIAFKEYPEVFIALYDDDTFGIHGSSLNFNSPSVTDPSKEIIQWRNVIISFSRSGGIYLDAIEINLGDEVKAPLVLISSKVSIQWGTFEHE
ncbi:hypothetical protein WB904_004100 [Vibrio parahaemolyticus]